MLSVIGKHGDIQVRIEIKAPRGISREWKEAEIGPDNGPWGWIKVKSNALGSEPGSEKYESRKADGDD